MNLYVGNLPYKLTEEELTELFVAYGEVTEAKIIKDRFTDRSKGFGFVEMASADEAKQAIDNLNGTSVQGRQIVVNEARPRKKSEDRGQRRW